LHELLPPWPLLTAFLAASLVLAITPGPGVLYILTRRLTDGRAAGLASVGGVALGNFGNALGAAVGLAALFAVSSLAFTAVKYAGAAYLVWLGIRILRAPAAATSRPGKAQRRRPAGIFRDGFLVALLNPKTALFFAAFLPQFMSAGAHPMAQSALLGTLFVLIAVLTDTVYVLAAGAVAPVVGRLDLARTAGRYLAASTFIGLGCLSALAGERHR
jgi:threonine/homoserine/homoserine lactone efflux protein